MALAAGDQSPAAEKEIWRDAHANSNYLMSDSHMWLKMWLWGTWKGLGWSAIIYISSISGIDPTLYEAATFNDGMIQINNTTWAQGAVNPDGDGAERFLKNTWASQVTDPRNEAEAVAYGYQDCVDWCKGQAQVRFAMQ